MLVGGLAVREVVVGAGFRFGRARAGSVDLLEHLGSRFRFSVTQVAPVLPDGAVCSSTAIREAIRTGNIAAANRMLGHPWLLEADFDRENSRQIVPHGDMILPPPARYAVTLSALAARPGVFRHTTLEVLHRVLQVTGNGLPAELPEKLGVAFEKRLSER